MTGTRMGNTPVWAKEVFTILNSDLTTIPAISSRASPLVHSRPWREPSTEFSLVHYYAVHRIKGFMRVRHFGFLANRCRTRCLALIRTAIAAPAPEPAEAPAVTAPFDGYPCPTCRTGRLHVRPGTWPRGGVVRG